MFALLLPLTIAGIAMTPSDRHDDPHERCMLVSAGMEVREAWTIMQRRPDSTLSGHSAAGPEGDPPAGSFAIDFWHTTDDQGIRRTSALRYRGGTVESVECGRIEFPVATPSTLQED